MAREFWLASSQDYEFATQKLKNKSQGRTKTPIHLSFELSLVDKKVENVAEWMKNKPHNV